MRVKIGIIYLLLVYCRISFHCGIKCRNPGAGNSALSVHLVLCYESYSHERDFEWLS